MKQTLRLTNVLNDQTRLNIYEYIMKKHDEVTVQEIAREFHIHPNVARLHLSKLEEVNMIISQTRKTGKGGRPYRVYRLSDHVIELYFPFRDYQLLAKIALETLASLGTAGDEALARTGKRFGQEMIQRLYDEQEEKTLTTNQKMNLLKEASVMLGLNPEFYYDEEEKSVVMKIFNCPFKELANEHSLILCNMHANFIRGMFDVLFEHFELKESENMFSGCDACTYQASL
ncbi:putative ArsR family transcriptional regulator [Melghiribacillus thermohalophilus]|uniref:Putative ArsR family transcriptional regulator n=1 Tax=Melghiribacillus thermohalophilus TaxID=1324956 RepID=A0A4R3NBD4_9BACI|nr:helix-turn-helix domain-containing protein [Melghiribacillus thermohalophilus]TCT26959.1 putative ArsR family transcriptional regulator [Melghiribacillus thermohalophilus]